MDRFFDKKHKKSSIPSQRHTSIGIATNVAVGPLGFRAELDISPKGERHCSHRDLEADRPDLTGTLDWHGARASRIVSLNAGGEDEGYPEPRTSTAGTIVGDDKHGDTPIGERR